MKFNRISILQLSGLFTKNLDEENNKYYESKYLKIRSYIICVVSFTALLRLIFCQIYDQYDSRQLFIGNLFNHLNYFSRYFLSIAGIVGISLIICLVINFRNLNNNQEKLILMWLKLTGTISIDDKEDEFKVIGISFKENKKYWMKQNNFNQKFSNGFYIYLTFICFSFNLPLLLMRYDGKFYIFILNLIVLIIHYSIYMHYILKILFFFNFFFFEIIFFFYFKLDKLIFKLNRINEIGSNEFNLKLNKLIFQFNYIYLETIKLNILFNKFIGISYLHLFLGEIVFIFVAIFGDIYLRIAMSVLVISIFILVLYLPFFLSNKLCVKMRKVNNILQNLSFNLITTQNNRYKINQTSFIFKFNDGYVFQCLNLFPLNSNYAFNTGLQIIMNALLLIRISQISYN